MNSMSMMPSIYSPENIAMIVGGVLLLMLVYLPALAFFLVRLAIVVAGGYMVFKGVTTGTPFVTQVAALVVGGVVARGLYSVLSERFPLVAEMGCYLGASCHIHANSMKAFISDRGAVKVEASDKGKHSKPAP